jgi:hypothetical protein
MLAYLSGSRSRAFAAYKKIIKIFIDEGLLVRRALVATSPAHNEE